jgi:hypothetical protein
VRKTIPSFTFASDNPRKPRSASATAFDTPLLMLAPAAKATAA